MNNPNSKSRRNGYSLMEVILSLSVLLIVTDSAVRVIRATTAMDVAGRELSNSSNQTDYVVRQLRRDVWGATAIDVSNEHSVKLTHGTKAVTWEIENDGSLKRTDDAGTRQWADVGRGWKFAAAGAVLTVSDEQSQGGSAVRLISQVILSRGGQ